MGACPTDHQHAERPVGAGFAGGVSPQLLVVVGAIAAALGGQSPSPRRRPRHRRPTSPADVRRSERREARREAEGPVPDGATVFDDEIAEVADARRRSAPCPAPGGDRCRRRRGRVRRHQRQAFPGVPGATAARGDLEVRLRTGSRPLGGHAQDVGARVGGRGRPRARPTPRRGCPSTAPSTACARSTATSPGTTNCAPKPSGTGARRCTPTRRTIRGCSREQHTHHPQ